MPAMFILNKKRDEIRLLAIGKRVMVIEVG
jgi:hypothetical protein